jgi:Tol biopolymer transport system component
VYEQFGSLHLYDLSTRQEHTVPITIHGDLPQLAPHLVPVSPKEVQNIGISPTGARVLVEAHGDIFTVPAEKGDTRNVTRTPGVAERNPAWSPDGKWIAYVRLTPTAEQIARMPAADGPEEILTSSTERAIHPNWAPDGQRLAYCTDDDLAPPKKNDADIIVLDLKTRDRRVLISGGVNTYPVWSPDGRRIAFRRMLGEHNSEVFLADSNGGNQRNLTAHPAFDGWPAWSPDGRYLAFASNREGDYQIYVMRPDGTHIHRVAATTGRATAPKWTPDGHRIYFSICRRQDDGFDCEIYSAPATMD